MATLYRVNLPNESALFPCDELNPKEQEFLETRKTYIREGLKNLFGDISTDDEVPLIGILGSGGGMRAAIAYGGAMNALYETGLLDVVAYAISVSGSTWYLSHLYSLEDWPKSSPGKLSEVFQKQLEWSRMKQLIKKKFEAFKTVLDNKRVSGHPGTLVDIFGEFLSHSLQPHATDAVLSDAAQNEGLRQCTAPLPLYTAIIVKPTVDVEKFHEWVEFSPYEVTMPKYGVSMNLKFFNKKLQGTESGDEMDEEKLGYLQGIWGSAFSVLASERPDISLPSGPLPSEGESIELDGEANVEALSLAEELKLLRQGLLKAAEEEGAQPALSGLQNIVGSVSDYSSVFQGLQKMWNDHRTQIVSTRAGRAAKIFSAVHGLQVTPVEGLPIADDELFQPYGVEEEDVEIIDAGIAINLPFPPLLRRKVKLILSFECSARETDNSSPLEVLKDAERWAKKHKIPFPEIDETLFAKEGMKEVYVFEDEKNPDCPIILHFPLVNLTYPEDFSIFPNEYPTKKFSYKKNEFNRLFKLMDHNVRRNISVIKSAIWRCINNK